MHTDPFIGRKVAFFFGPLALALATLVSAKAKAWFGVEVNTTEAAAFIISIGAGVITWLYNLGKHEVAQVTGIDEGTVDKLVRKAIDEKLPEAAGGASATIPSPRVPEPPEPPTPAAGPGGTSAGQ